MTGKDANADGMSNEGESSSLAANGVTSLSTTTNAVDYPIDGQSIVGLGEFLRSMARRFISKWR